MAQDNQKPQNSSKVDWTDELKEYLTKLATTSYSISGLTPNESKWYLTEMQVSKILQKHASAFIHDIEECNFKINRRTGEMTGFVWIRTSSPDINDSELRKSESALNRSIRRFSKPLKEFMDKFCRKNEKRLVDSNDSRFVGIPVNLQLILELEFDATGIHFANRFGDKYRRKTELVFTPIFERDKFSCLEVYKKLPDQMKGPRNLRERRSYNA